MTATAATSLDPSVRQVTPIALPSSVTAIPPDPEAVIWALRAALNAAQFVRSGQPPSGLALAHPDQWLPDQVGMLTQAAAAVGYPVNLVRLIPISTATAHNSAIYPDDGPASAAARGALLAATGPASQQIPQQSAPQWNPPPVGPTPPARRAAWIWAAVVLALLVVIAGGITTAVIVVNRGDDTVFATDTTMASAPPRPNTSPTTTSAPVPGAGNPSPPETLKPDVPAETAPPPETTTPPAETPPTTSKPSEPEPTQPSTSEKPPPPKDTRDAMIRGYCQGLLKQVDRYPGGLPAMRAQVPPPFTASPSDWAEAFDRAATGSCE
ncbi:hypothetical protein AB0N05_15780 [Nocardia sp. NPDC051030]|uniref:hypothetical protein n=1 Tax=Nocardia sp. NPDC051030 TaxID=3155162 RepID=UPI003447CEC6